MNATLRRWLASAGAMRRVLSTFAPYIGAGIRVTHIAEDFSSARVEMGQHWYNTNYTGTHFGGSLYSMVDPMYMLLLMRRLGNEYIVWDKSASIDFIRPGKGKVIAGWEGLALGMREGSKLIARIPAQYAYGDKGVGPIPPGATLVFYMECLKLGNIRGDKPRLPEF